MCWWVLNPPASNIQHAHILSRHAARRYKTEATINGGQISYVEIPSKPRYIGIHSMTGPGFVKRLNVMQQCMRLSQSGCFLICWESLYIINQATLSIRIQCLRSSHSNSVPSTRDYILAGAVSIAMTMLNLYRAAAISAIVAQIRHPIVNGAIITPNPSLNIKTNGVNDTILNSPGVGAPGEYDRNPSSLPTAGSLNAVSQFSTRPQASERPLARRSSLRRPRHSYFDRVLRVLRCRKSEREATQADTRKSYFPMRSIPDSEPPGTATASI